MKDFEELNKEDFIAYERVRVEGRYNMFDPNAQLLSGLDNETYISVLKHYSKLMEKWPGVRQEEDY